jgi:hypothetical protein
MLHHQPQFPAISYYFWILGFFGYKIPFEWNSNECHLKMRQANWSTRLQWGLRNFLVFANTIVLPIFILLVKLTRFRDRLPLDKAQVAILILTTFGGLFCFPLWAHTVQVGGVSFTTAFNHFVAMKTYLTGKADSV